MKRLLAVLACAIAAMAIGVPIAHAADGADDPKDVSGNLDIKRVSDSVSGDEVTYRIETYNGFDDTRDFFILRARFDLSGTGQRTDFCFRASVAGGSVIRAVLFPKCGPAAWATTDAIRPAPNVMEFKWPIGVLMDCCGVVPGRGFTYTLMVEDQQGHIDIAPNAGMIAESGLPAIHRAGTTGERMPNELAGAGTLERGSVSTKSAAQIAARQRGSSARWLLVGLLALVVVIATLAALFLRGRIVWVDTPSKSKGPPDPLPTNGIDAREADASNGAAPVHNDSAGESGDQSASRPTVVARVKAPRPTGDPRAEGWPIDSLLRREESSHRQDAPGHPPTAASRENDGAESAGDIPADPGVHDADT